MMQYSRPDSVAGVIEALAQADHGQLLAGGTDLLVEIRRSPFASRVLVDLKAARDLPPPIEITETAIRFGPTATMSMLAVDARLQEMCPALVSASTVVGSVAIRNRATLIGNLCNASPAADIAPSLLVHGARVTVAGPSGERNLPLVDFFVGPGRTACAPDELVLRVELPKPEDDLGTAFERLTRRRGVDLATVSVAAAVTATGDVRLGLGAVGPTPLLATTAEPVDLHDSAALDRSIEDLVAVSRPISDLRASSEYRTATTKVLSKRAVLRAAANRTERSDRP